MGSVPRLAPEMGVQLLNPMNHHTSPAGRPRLKDAFNNALPTRRELVGEDPAVRLMIHASYFIPLILGIVPFFILTALVIIIHRKNPLKK